MANVLWTHEKHAPVMHSWRASGDLLAKVRGKGDYMDWYMSSERATVPRWVQRSMAEKGWTPKG
jgi:hypothetical protein